MDNSIKMYHSIIQASHSIGVKWYIGLGAVVGGANGFLSSHGTDLILTFAFGFFGASGAGIAKLIWDYLGVKLKKKQKKEED